MSKFEEEATYKFKVIYDVLQDADRQLLDLYGQVESLQNRMDGKDKEVQELNSKILKTRRVQTLASVFSSGIGLAALSALMRNPNSSIVIRHLFRGLTKR